MDNRCRNKFDNYWLRGNFSNKQVYGKSYHLAVDHHDHSWIVPEGGIFISMQQMGSMRFPC